MTRTETIAASVVAVLATVGVGQLYLDRGSPASPQKPQPVVEARPGPAHQTKPVSADEVVSGFMTSLEQGTDDQKTVALAGLLDELESPAYAKSALSLETAEPLVAAAVAAVTVSTQAETAELAALRARLAGFAAERTHGPSSKEWVLKMLEEGTPEVRAAIAHGVGRPHGVRGRSVFEKLAQIGETGQIPAVNLVPALKRLGGQKALGPILAQLKSAYQWRAIGACVTALEDYQDPALLGPALERLGQTGLLESNERLPWISAKLFGQYMGKAEGSALALGLRAAKTRPSLVKVSLAAVKRGLDDANAETRRVAAEAVRKAVTARALDPHEAEGLLAGRLGHETQPVLKAELTGSLEQVRGLMPAPQGQQ